MVTYLWNEEHQQCTSLTWGITHIQEDLWAASLKWGIPYKIAIIGIETQLNIDELGLDSHAFKETSPQLLDYKHQEQHL